jgi:UMF1 family MFS transporter
MQVGKKFTIFSWSMYDFANTMFSMNVISLYFPVLIIVNMKSADIVYSSVLSGSMLFAALSAPVFGAISDRLGRRMPFLIILTLICCLFTACIGVSNRLVLMLVCFVMANYCYQLADIFYNALLPEISDKKQIGRTSGYGVGLGYGGTIVGLLLTRFFFLKYGVKATFIPTAFFFLLFALPCFLFVKDRNKKSQKLDWNIIPDSFLKIKKTLKNIENYSELFTFLVSAFIILNVVNTVIVFMSVYTKQVIGFTDSQVNIFYIISSILAIVGSLFSGFMTDKMGPKKTLSCALLLWCITILLAILSSNKILFWLVGFLAGVSLGATWTSARTLVARLSPPYMFGEVFGFYGLVGKSASIVGPMIWGISVLVFEPLGMIKYRMTIFILLLFLIGGFLILQKVPDKVDRI